MQIKDIVLTCNSDVLRAEASIVWEDSDRVSLRFYAQVEARFADWFCADPNGFLLAALIPAWHASERRVRVDGGLCAILSERVKAALLTLRSWYPELGHFPAIEASRGFETRQPSKPQAASFLSCGIDSLATLRWNLLHVDAAHPARIKAAIVLDYIKGHGWTEKQEAGETKRRREAGARVTTEVGIPLIAVRTNILELHDRPKVFARQSHSSVLSSSAYFLGRGFSKAYIASSDAADGLAPWGSHPLLDPFYSSAHLAIEHDGLQMCRFEKTALLSAWSIALNNILVCTNRDYDGPTNCGTCEKCVRTMTALVALGKLSNCRSFPANDVSADLLNSILQYGLSDYQRTYYADLVGPLEACGRRDLVSVVQRHLPAGASPKEESARPGTEGR
jgi:hypothetical protein